VRGLTPSGRPPTRWREPAPQLLLVPDLALLIPGSFGLRCLESLLTGKSVTGLEQGFQRS